VVVGRDDRPVGARITHLLNDSPMFRAQRVPASGEVVDSLTTEVEQKRLGGFLIVTDAPRIRGKPSTAGPTFPGSRPSAPSSGTIRRGRERGAARA